MTPNSELQAICHAAADLLARGWTPKHEAVDRFQKAVHPTHPDAVAWSMHGALVRAAADALEDEDETERVVNRLSRLLSIPCSRVSGTEREPFVTVSHYEDQMGLFPSDAEQRVRETAALVAAGTEIPSPPFNHGWWDQVTGGEE